MEIATLAGYLWRVELDVTLTSNGMWRPHDGCLRGNRNEKRVISRRPAGGIAVQASNGSCVEV
jgi:hypothetical protein